MWFAASVIGNAEFWVILVNRSHALPIAHRRLKLLRRLHDLAVPLWPLLLLWLNGLEQGSLLRGGSLWQQSLGTRRLVLFTSFWCLTLILQVLHWQFRQKRQARDCTASRLHDVAAETKDSTVAGAPGWLARVWPGNQYCQLDVNLKQIAIRTSRQRPEQPRQTLRILHFSDLHFTGTPGLSYYEFLVQQAELQAADLIVFTGDLVDKPQLLPDAVRILQPLTRIAPCLFVLGNHDWRYDYEQIRQQLVESGWRSVAGTAMLLRIRDRMVLIGGSERPWMSNEPPQVRESFSDLTVLLSHSPDQLRRAEQLGYDLMLSGHTHGGQVILPLIGPVFSPSRYGVALAAGLFKQQSPVLHVTRGVGAKDPVRWNCSPELTLLEVSF